MDSRTHTNANIFLSLLPPHFIIIPLLCTAETLEMLVVLIYDEGWCPPAARVTAVNWKSDYSCLIPADLCIQIPLQSENSMVHSEYYVAVAAGPMKDRCLTVNRPAMCACDVPFTDSVTGTSGILCIWPPDGTNLIVLNDGKMTGASFPFLEKKIFLFSVTSSLAKNW